MEGYRAVVFIAVVVLGFVCLAVVGGVGEYCFVACGGDGGVAGEHDGPVYDGDFPVPENPSRCAVIVSCEQNGGVWFDRHNECGLDSSGVPVEEFDAFCTEQLGGRYTDCAAAYGCRHADSGVPCTGTEQCFHVCSFGGDADC